MSEVTWIILGLIAVGLVAIFVLKGWHKDERTT